MPPGHQWRPLLIWSEGGPLNRDEVALLRLAKEALALEYAVKPQVADRGDLENRVLAWGTRPPFLCHYALVDPQGSPRELEHALGWALGEWDDAPTSVTLEAQLQAWLGPAVREIPLEQVQAEARLADYEAGRD
jgi:hypothetical protein